VKTGAWLTVLLFLATVALVAVGTEWPVPAAAAYAGGDHVVSNASTPEAAVRNLCEDIRAHAWDKAHESLFNKAEFSAQDLQRDLVGTYPGLLTYAALDSFELQPLHAGASDADVRLTLKWATVVGLSRSTRDLRVVRNGNQWQVEWPIEKRPTLPPQVIPVNYLRWDVIYRGPGDDWGAQDVDAPNVRIVDMHPVQRAEGTVILGELLNDDVVPAYVSVDATLLGKDQTEIATEGSFDKISHVLLPKQVTPFLIQFPGVSLSDVASVRMKPFSSLIAASADPVIEIQNEHLNPAPDASLSGQLVNESGQTVNIAHVLGTFYDRTGHVVWVADQYVDHAVLPQTPSPFDVHIPEDLARDIASQRTVVASYSFGGLTR
jgi:hypothetical protein